MICGHSHKMPKYGSRDHESPSVMRLSDFSGLQKSEDRMVWSEITRPKYERTSARYQSDVTDAE